MLNKAINAFNNIVDLELAGVESELEAIRTYLSDQSIRLTNTRNGYEYLNREMDIVARLKKCIPEREE